MIIGIAKANKPNRKLGNKKSIGNGYKGYKSCKGCSQIVGTFEVHIISFILEGQNQNRNLKSKVVGLIY